MTEYRKIVDDHLQKLRGLRAEQDRIQREIKHISDLVRAAMHMMPDQERGAFTAELEQLLVQRQGLTNMVRDIITVHNPEFMTPIQVRDEMEKAGFDFRSYTSNPLSSIHTVLRRFKRSEVETRTFPDGTVGYRWRLRKK